MDGYISNYNSEKGYGFIQTVTGNYFFHISNVISDEKPEKYNSVIFTPSINEKGNSALEVKISKENNSKNKFVNFGEVRIKHSNIKSYGISKQGTVYDIYQKVWKKILVKKGFFGNKYEYRDLNELTLVAIKSEKNIFNYATIVVNGNDLDIVDNLNVVKRSGSLATILYRNKMIIFPSEYGIELIHEERGGFVKAKLEDFKEEKFDIHYLFVTTFQNDNYKFIEGQVDFNIFEKLKELDGVRH